jgi:hypothetical protein
MVRSKEHLGALLGLAVAMGCGRLGYDHLDENPNTGDTDAQADWVFLDNSQASFDLGDYAGSTVQLVWNGEQVEFAGSPPFDTTGFGLYVSAPFDTGDETAVWETLSWIPEAPHGKPLPELGASDSGYASGGASMADNILLLHMDDTTLAQDSLVIDMSGSDHDGRIILDGQQASSIGGEFNDAFDLDRDAWVSLDGNYFDFGTSDFTYSVWVKMYPCSDSNDNKIALGGAGTNDRPHMWLGSLCPEQCPGGDHAFMNFLDDSRDGPSLSVCSGVRLDDGQWHHLATNWKG